MTNKNSINRWSGSPHGQQFLSVEKMATDRALKSLGGPNILLLGDALSTDQLVKLDFPQLVSVTPNNKAENENHSLAADCAFLPFADRSFASVVLPHVLETHDLPHQVLREVHRVMQPDGHLLLTCFNPVSFIGLQKTFRTRAAPNGVFYSVSRVKDWLHLLGFEVVGSAMYHYAPLTHSAVLTRHLAFLNSLGDRWLPLLGGSFLISARKRELGMRLVGRLSSAKGKRSPGLAPAPARRVENSHLKRSNTADEANQS